MSKGHLFYEDCATQLVQKWQTSLYTKAESISRKRNGRETKMIYVTSALSIFLLPVSIGGGGGGADN
jgi:hypothetical protein